MKAVTEFTDSKIFRLKTLYNHVYDSRYSLKQHRQYGFVVLVFMSYQQSKGIEFCILILFAWWVSTLPRIIRKCNKMQKDNLKAIIFRGKSFNYIFKKQYIFYLCRKCTAPIYCALMEILVVGESVFLIKFL